MDGVVVDNKDFHFEAWQVFAGLHGFKAGNDEIKSWFGGTNETILRNLFKREMSLKEIERMGEEKEILYRNLFEGHIKVLKGLPEFIASLRSEGIKIGLATSAPTSNVIFVLEKTGLSGSFDVIVDASMISNGKPNPEIFLRAAEVLKVPAESVVVFEDSIHGINAAISAGMKVIGVATTHDAKDIRNTDMVINDFSDIKIPDLIRLFENRDE